MNSQDLGNDARLVLSIPLVYLVKERWVVIEETLTVAFAVYQNWTYSWEMKMFDRIQVTVKNRTVMPCSMAQFTQCDFP